MLNLKSNSYLDVGQRRTFCINCDWTFPLSQYVKDQPSEHIIRIVQRAFLDPLLDAKFLQLHCRRRITRHDARMQGCLCRVSTATGNRRIDPPTTLRLEGHFQFTDGLGLAARGSPVQDLDGTTRLRCGGPQQQVSSHKECGHCD